MSCRVIAGLVVSFQNPTRLKWQRFPGRLLKQSGVTDSALFLVNLWSLRDDLGHHRQFAADSHPLEILLRPFSTHPLIHSQHRLPFTVSSCLSPPVFLEIREIHPEVRHGFRPSTCSRSPGAASFNGEQMSLQQMPNYSSAIKAGDNVRRCPELLPSLFGKELKNRAINNLYSFYRVVSTHSARVASPLDVWQKTTSICHLPINSKTKRRAKHVSAF